MIKYHSKEKGGGKERRKAEGVGEGMKNRGRERREGRKKGRKEREGWREGGKEGRGKTVLSFWPLIVTFLKQTVAVTKVDALMSLELIIYPPPHKKKQQPYLYLINVPVERLSC